MGRRLCPGQGRHQELREKLRGDELSGYLFIGDLPDPIRDQIIRALRDDLVLAMEAGPPVHPLFQAKVRELARLAAGLP